MTNQVVLRNIEKIYKGTKTAAVKGVNLEIEKGEFFCLVGPSGCGKSTILKIIAGLEKQTSGEISVNGKVSMVFQSGALLPWLTVRENVEFGMEMLGLPKHQIEKQAAKYIDLVELAEVAKKYPRELSGGQRQRVGLARALSVEPEILLLDEPFSALDTLTTEELHNCLLKIWQETGKTIVLVSHALDEAVLLADRVGVMKNGELVQILNNSDNRPRKENSGSYDLLISKIKKDFGE